MPDDESGIYVLVQATFTNFESNISAVKLLPGIKTGILVMV